MDGRYSTRKKKLNSHSENSYFEKYRSVFEGKAKENLSLGGGDQKSPLPKSRNPISSVNSREELAKIAGVGQDTYSKGKKILESGNEEVKQKVMSGEMKINTAYFYAIQLCVI